MHERVYSDKHMATPFLLSQCGVIPRSFSTLRTLFSLPKPGLPMIRGVIDMEFHRDQLEGLSTLGKVAAEIGKEVPCRRSCRPIDNKEK